MTTRSTTYPSITVIVPVYNGAETMAMCLESLTKLTYPKDRLEIIVVDNGSSDCTREIVSRYPVLCFEETSFQSSYAARNTGIKAAKGDLIAFTDSDCIVTPDWLIHLVSVWDDKEYGCFAGEIEAYKPQSVIEKFSDREGTLRQKGTLSCPYLPYTQTANSAYRREVFDKIGMFIPEMTSGGDAEIAWRMQKKLKLKIKFIPEALVYHKHRTTLKGLYRQYKKYEYGKLLWKRTLPDYNLPAILQRKLELKQATNVAYFTLLSNLSLFVRGKIDFVSLAAPFLRVVMALATYTACLETRAERKLLSPPPRPKLIDEIHEASSWHTLGDVSVIEDTEATGDSTKCLKFTGVASAGQWSFARFGKVEVAPERQYRLHAMMRVDAFSGEECFLKVEFFESGKWMENLHYEIYNLKHRQKWQSFIFEFTTPKRNNLTMALCVDKRPQEADIEADFYLKFHILS